MRNDLTLNNGLAIQILGTWALIAGADIFVWRGTGTGLVHAVFSVLHDPATTLLNAVVIPAIFCALWIGVPFDVVRQAARMHKQKLMLAMLFAIVVLNWHAVSDATRNFCRQAPLPEDISDRATRANLTGLQANYWSSFASGSPDDMAVAKQDYLLALTRARGADCATIKQFVQRSSVRAKWLLFLDCGGQLLLAGLFCVFVAHMLTGVRVERLFLEALAVGSAVASVYPALAYYSDWYASFGEIVVERSDAGIAGIALASGALLVLWGPASVRKELWQHLAGGLAAAGLFSNLFCILTPETFVHFAGHVATSSLAVVFFAEMLVTGLIFFTVNRFVNSVS